MQYSTEELVECTGGLRAGKDKIAINSVKPEKFAVLVIIIIMANDTRDLYKCLLIG